MTTSLSELCEALARRLRERVLPELGSHAGRVHGAMGAGGDVTFAIDEGAEAELEAFLAEHAPELAFYSEDRGLVAPPGAEHVLVVDPIDGTRPAMAGLESACVSVAAAPLAHGEPTMGAVEVATIVEVKTGREYHAVRGGGVRSTAPVALSANTSLDRMFWTYGFRGRPSRMTVEVLGDLIDGSSVGGATFELGSACFDSMCVLTGQLDAYLEPGPRLVAEIPSARAAFERVGNGRVLNNSPYDLAAAVLLLEEAGAVVTDATGRTLRDRPLLGSGAEYQMSILACGNAELHALVLAEVDRGIDRARDRFG
jgi:myo-inositol-1(or 4)-monophosphatase